MKSQQPRPPRSQNRRTLTVLLVSLPMLCTRPAAAAPEDPAVVADSARTTSRSGKNKRPAPLPPGLSPLRVAIEQILVRHSRSFEPSAKPRTIEDARKIAARARELVVAGELTFHRACEKYSDDAVSRRRGGFIGTFGRFELSYDMRAADAAIFTLKPGEVSHPVETPLGIHLFRRIAIREWAGAHILVQYAGAERAPPTEKRTREDAQRIAATIAEAARGETDAVGKRRAMDKTSFARLAAEKSESPDAATGGALGTFGPYEILPALESAISKLRIGEVGGPVESRLGWHVVRREPVGWLHAAHILVRYKGCRDDDGASRSRTEALKHSRKILELVRAPSADFFQLAQTHSEDGASASRGGSVGVFGPGRMAPKFEAATRALKLGGASDVVETDFGFHIIKRLPIE